MRVRSISSGLLVFALAFPVHAALAAAVPDCPPDPCTIPAPPPPPPPPKSPSNSCEDGAPWPCESKATYTKFLYGSLTGGFAFGLGPSISPLVLIRWGLKWDAFSLEGGGGAVYGGWDTPAGKTSFEWLHGYGDIAGCVEVNRVLGCGLVGFGLFSANGRPDDWRAHRATMEYPTNNDGRFVSAGLRVGYVLPLNWGVFVRANIDATRTLKPVRVHGGGDPIWTSPDYAAILALSFGFAWLPFK